MIEQGASWTRSLFMKAERMQRLSSLARSGAFRLAISILILGAHLFIVSSFARERFGLPMNRDPGNPPHFVEPSVEWYTSTWDRLAVSRWDSCHYISLLERGYSQCPPQDMRHAAVGQARCNLNFYPGYPALTWLVNLVLRLPSDYALFAVSIAASLLFLFLWTDRIIVDALGVGGAYASLLAFNAFTTAFALVTPQTEPCTLLFTLGAFLAFARRRLLLAAILAGAASAMRISGAATGIALGLAILCQLFLERPQRKRDWVVPALSAVLSVWGVVAIMGYHWYRFRDPLLYVHAHAQTYAHSGSFASLIDPQTEWLLRSVDHPLHEGVVLAFATVWFLLGRKQAMSGFSVPERVFWYTLTVVGVLISVLGTIELGLSGMNRYLLLILPLFFAMGSFLKSRPGLFAVWIVISFWHYRQADLCDYLGGVGEGRFSRCHVPQWVGHW
jgi:hypothetical protein